MPNREKPDRGNYKGMRALTDAEIARVTGGFAYSAPVGDCCCVSENDSCPMCVKCGECRYYIPSEMKNPKGEPIGYCCVPTDDSLRGE